VGDEFVVAAIAPEARLTRPASLLRAEARLAKLEEKK